MKNLTLFIIIALLFLGTAVFAEDINLSSPGLTPDSFFYLLDTLGEKISLIFTFNAEKKAEKAWKFAEEKLAEVKAMAEKNNAKALEKADEKYQEFLELANEKSQEAKKQGKDVEKLLTSISERALKHQEVLTDVLDIVPEEAKKRIENAIEMSQKGFENAIQAVTGEKRGEMESRFEEMGTKIKEKLEALKEKLPEQIDKDVEEAKTEIEAPAASGETQKPKQERKTLQTQPKPISSPSPNTSLPWVTGLPQLEFPSIYLTGQPIMMRSPGSPMPQPVAEKRPILQSIDDDKWCAKKRMRIDDYGVKYILEMLGVETVKVGSVDCRACHIRKFSEGGVLAAERWDDMYFWYLQKLSGKWACEKSINYKNFIGSEWTDYYQISESWSPKNFYYQCVKKEGAYVSGNADFCEKDVPATAILPPAATSASAPTPAPVTLVACCSASGGCKLVDTKETCLGMSGKPMSISSCSPNPCSQPTPVYNECKQGPMKDYKCLGGTLVKWQCKCTAEADGEETRLCSVKPAESCPTGAAPLTITGIDVRHLLWMTKEWTIVDHIFWKTNALANSYVEYGPTISYGFTAGFTASPSMPTTEHGTNALPDLQRNTTYHFRIIAEDVQGHKIVSDDYTFTTGL